ncbi:hypothetical protein TRVA0_015S01332 [Trichomonascus vanleenenianus]|uniref:uncharacterized protein n=1 Tax=Trichomonascus vanleenenianus TaxID=2268995 RepID=UPI003ECB5D7F
MVVLNTTWGEYKYEMNTEGRRFKKMISNLFLGLSKIIQIAASPATLKLVIPLHCRAVYSISYFCRSAMTEYYIALLNHHFDNLYRELVSVVTAKKFGERLLAQILTSSLGRVDDNITVDFDLWGDHSRCKFRDRPRLILAWVDLIASLIHVPALKELSLRDLVNLYRVYTDLVRPCFACCYVGPSPALLHAYDSQAAILWFAYYHKGPWVPRVEYAYQMVRTSRTINLTDARAFYNLVSEGGYGSPHREVDLLKEDRVSLGSVCCPESPSRRIRKVVEVDLANDELTAFPGVSLYELELCRMTSLAIDPDQEDPYLKIAIFTPPFLGDEDIYRALINLAKVWCHFEVLSRVLESDSPLDKSRPKGVIRSVVETINATQEGVYSFEPFSFNPCFSYIGSLEDILVQIERGSAVDAVKRLYLYVLAGSFLSAPDSMNQVLASMSHDQLVTVTSMIHAGDIQFCGREKFAIALFLYRAVRHLHFRATSLLKEARDYSWRLLMGAVKSLDMYSLSVLFQVHPDVFNLVYKSATTIPPSALAALYLLVDKGAYLHRGLLPHLNRAAFGLFGCVSDVEFVASTRHKFLLTIEGLPKGGPGEGLIKTIALTVLRCTVTQNSWLILLDAGSSSIPIFILFCNRAGTSLIQKFLDSPAGQRGLTSLTRWTVNWIKNHVQVRSSPLIDLLTYFCLVSHKARTVVRGCIEEFDELCETSNLEMLSWSPRLGALILLFHDRSSEYYDLFNTCLARLVSNCVTLCSSFSKGRFTLHMAQGSIFLAAFFVVCPRSFFARFEDGMKKLFATVFFQASYAYSYSAFEQSLLAIARQKIATLPMNADLEEFLLQRSMASFNQSCDLLVRSRMSDRILQTLESVIPDYVCSWFILNKLGTSPKPLYHHISKRKQRRMKRACFKLLRTYERRRELLIAILLGKFLETALNIQISMDTIIQLAEEDQATKRFSTTHSGLVLVPQLIFYNLITNDE